MHICVQAQGVAPDRESEGVPLRLLGGPNPLCLHTWVCLLGFGAALHLGIEDHKHLQVPPLGSLFLSQSHPRTCTCYNNNKCNNYYSCYYYSWCNGRC